jgi:glucose-6-phosphate 1-epimerase
VEIELWSGQTKAIVDPLGAWLTNLSDDNGDILFPRRLLKTVDGETKKRGGSHICLPNFGPGGDSGLVQHGFAREIEWTVGEKSDSIVTLTLERGEGEYVDMSASLTYQLSDCMLNVTLEVKNNSGSDMRVAPGFHPYFAIMGDGPVLLNDEKQDLNELSVVRFTEADEQKLAVSDRVVTLKSEQLTTWAERTDLLGSYICVEPTLKGFAFLNDKPAAEELIVSGATKRYVFSIDWRA